MGLDMYLKRANLHGYTPEQAEAANAYYSMMEHNKENPVEQYTSIQEWAGVDDSLLDMGAVEALRSQYRPTYFDFDVDKLFPMYDVFEQVGYWRKANAIHRWFVQNVQDGVDDCGTYIVTREQLEQLKAACERVLAIAQIVDGKICTGISLDGEEERRIMEDGKVVGIDTKLEKIKEKFDLTPNGIIEYLGLKQPIYTKTTNYGHFALPKRSPAVSPG